MKQSGPLASMARKGTGTDTMVGHLTPGEIVVPRKVAAEDSVMRKLKEAFESAGLNFPQYVVGSDANRPNPHTGAPMFEGGEGDGGGGDGGDGGEGEGGEGEGGEGEGGEGQSGDGGNNGGGGFGGESGSPAGDTGGVAGGNVGEGFGGGYGGGFGGESGSPAGDTGGVQGGNVGEGFGGGYGGGGGPDTMGSPGMDAAGPSNPGGQFGGGEEMGGPGVSPGDSDPTGGFGGIMGGGPSLGSFGDPFGGADTYGSPGMDAAGPSNPGGQFGGGQEMSGPGVSPGDSDPTGATPGSVMGGGPSLGGLIGGVLGGISDLGDEADIAAPNATTVSNVNTFGMPLGGGFVAPGVNPITGAPVDQFGANQVTVQGFFGGPESQVGTIGTTPGAGQFGTTGPVGAGPGTIGGGVPGGPNANFGDPGVTGYGGAAQAAAEAAQAAADAIAGATGGVAGTAGPDTVGAFGVDGVTSNDQTADVSAPFGGQSTGVLGGTQMGPSGKGRGGPGFGMTSATDVYGGAPYAGAEIGFLGATGVPGTRADVRAEQQAHLDAQQAAVTAARAVGSPYVGSPTAMQAPTLAAAPAPATPAPTVAQAPQAPAQTPAQSPLAAVSTPDFNAAQIAAAIASMGTRPSAPTDVAQDTAQRGPTATQSNVSFGPTMAGQPNRAASSIAAPEQSKSVFGSIVDNITDPNKIGTVAINTGLGILAGPLSAALQGASYLGTGQSVGANLMGGLTGSWSAPGGILGGGPTAGFNAGPSNPNLSPGEGGGGAGEGGSMVAGGGVPTGPGGITAPTTVATGTTGAGSIPTSSGQYPTGFARSFQGLPNDLTQYGYGPEYSFYAAKGGRVESPLNKMRRR